MRALIAFLLLSFTRALLAGDEPLLQPNDVIALIGGEDMVVASEFGYLEACVQRALPNHKAKFRSLAWEGDTVFEQRRDLNYPPLEAQLDKIGATIVIAQFGQAESFAGPEKVEEFARAYAKLLERLRGPGNRRFLLVLPNEPDFSQPGAAAASKHIGIYGKAIRKLAEQLGDRGRVSVGHDFLPNRVPVRDGVHLSDETHRMFGQALALDLVEMSILETVAKKAAALEQIRSLVIAKNRLWHHYSRPQNWAFLAGDRTNQPSSRDHIDRNIRWFPAELEQFLPLVEAKEREIWELAAKLKQ